MHARTLPPSPTHASARILPRLPIDDTLNLSKIALRLFLLYRLWIETRRRAETEYEIEIKRQHQREREREQGSSLERQGARTRTSSRGILKTTMRG